MIGLCNTTTIHSVTANSNSIYKYGKFELTIDLVSTWKNPYDYDEMDLQCIFYSPSGKQDTVDAFYIEPYIMNASTLSAVSNGKAKYTIRFSPGITGKWRYALIYKSKNAPVTGMTQTFVCTEAGNKGFIRKGKSNYAGFDNGEQFIAIGENVNCPDKNIFKDYTNWMSKLAANGANVMNVWMIFSGFGIEWTGNKDRNFKGLKNYNQVNAYHLDWLLEECEKKDLYVLLGLNTCGNVSSTINPPWSENPYSASAGGPCINQGDFFEDPQARQLHKNRLRYIIARYGYSTKIMGWNLFIEVDGIYNYKQYQKQVTNWHSEMGTYLKARDVNKHLVTTSYSSDKQNEATWQLPAIDITQTHFYVKTSNPEKTIANGNRTYLRKYKKPTMTGEFGIDPENIALEKLDPKGVYFHNVIWATALGGAMGTALTYWWANYIEPQNLYYHFKPLSAFVNKIPLAKENYRPVAATVTSRSTEIIINPSAGWGSETDTLFTVDQKGNISPGDERLGVYLYGRLLNTQWRRPVVFNVNYLEKGYFTIVTGDATAAPELAISIDNKNFQRKKVMANGGYTFNIPAGNHTIRVENSGKDWLWVKQYSFSNAGAALNTYVLKNESNTKAAGYILNEGYNWKATFNKQRMTQETGELTIPGMNNGNYLVVFYDPLNLQQLQRVSATSSAGKLTVKIPKVYWDMAFTIEKQ